MELPQQDALWVGCSLSRAQLARLRQAAGSVAVVREIATPGDARSTLRELAPRVAVVLVGESRGDRDETIQLIAYVAQNFRDIGIVAFNRLGPAHAGLSRDLARAGAHELLWTDLDEPITVMRSAVESAIRECTATAVLDYLRPALPHALHSFAQKVVRNPTLSCDVGGVAKLLRMNRKTLYNLCAQHRVPPPSELLMWCRLIHAAHLYQRSDRTLEAVSISLDFTSPTTLRNRIKAYTGLKATDLRSRGGADAVIRCLQRRMADISAARIMR